MKFDIQIVFEVENPKIMLKVHQNELFYSCFVFKWALCFSVWCTYLPFPKMAPLGKENAFGYLKIF